MSKHHTIWLLALVLALAFGTVFVVDAQTTNVQRDFNFSGTSNVTNVGGFSIGTTTVNSGSITFGDGTVFTSSDAASAGGQWTSTSTGIVYNDGRVGIGTNSPNNLLHAAGPIYGSIFYDHDNAAWLVNPSGESYFSGNVGIGTTTPSTTLHVNGSDSMTAALRVSNSGSRKIRLNRGSNEAMIGMSNEHSIWFDAGNDGADWYMDPSGNVGLGTTNPGSKLQVDGNIEVTNGKLDLSHTGNSNPVIVGEDGSLSLLGTTWLRSDNTNGVALRNSANNDVLLAEENGDVVINNGNVGIGTASPVTPLHVANATNPGLLAQETDGNVDDEKVLQRVTAGIYEFKSLNDDNTTRAGNILAFDMGTGDIGIGTGSPGAKLDVEGQLTMNFNKIINLASPANDSDAATKSYVDSTAGGGVPDGSDGQTLYNSAGSWVASDKIYVASSTGNVGIGGAPIDDSTLEVDGTVSLQGSDTSYKLLKRPYIMRSADSGGSSLPFSNYDNFIFHVNNGRSFVFTEDSSERMVIETGGNVGIGTTNPSGEFEVQGSGHTDLHIDSGGTSVPAVRWQVGGTSQWGFLSDHVSDKDFGLYDYTNNTYRMVWLDNGNVGIGDNTPSGRLDVNGEAYASLFRDKDNTSYYVNPSGNSLFNGDLSLAQEGQRVVFANDNTSSIYRSDNGAGSTNNLIVQARAGLFLVTDSNSGGGDHIVFGANDSPGGGSFTEYAEFDAGGNLEMNGNNIENADKIDANTVDPVYNIGGTKYATYMAGMTGVKEETTGVAELDCERQPGPDCTSTIDFNEVPRGSHLWLFFRTSDFGDGWKELRVIVTPQQEGSVWSAGYEVRPEEKKLVLNAEPLEVQEPLNEVTPEVSYRLTAPRFDANEWSNYYEGDSEGMTVPVE